MSNRWTVLVTARNFDAAGAEVLRAAGCVVRQPELGGRDPDVTALPGLLEGVDAWIVGTTEIGHALLAAHPRLGVMVRRGVGYERIDIGAAHALGRVVAIAAGGNGPSVADHALGLMLAVCKQLVTLTEQVRRGVWTVPTGLELHEKVVGIVGLGRVGRLVARRLRGFDCKVLAVDIAPDEAFAAAHGVDFVGLDTLLRESDVVSLHAPLTDATRHMIDAGALAAMKLGAILVNTARGGLVDEPALATALRSGHLAGAGLDVFWAETDAGARPAAEALAGLPTVVATPHTAAATKEGLARSNRIAAETTAMLLAGEAPPEDRIVTDGRGSSLSGTV